VSYSLLPLWGIAGALGARGETPTAPELGYAAALDRTVSLLRALLRCALLLRAQHP